MVKIISKAYSIQLLKKGKADVLGYTKEDRFGCIYVVLKRNDIGGISHAIHKKNHCLKAHKEWRVK